MPPGTPCSTGSRAFGVSMPDMGRTASSRPPRSSCASLPYATGYFGLGSEPAIRLAAGLAELAPGDLNHVYFTLGGSDAIDSTIRFIRYYYHARGMPQKDQFISVEYGYHGSSTAGSGLTALAAFHAGFGVPYDWQHKIPSHYAYRNPVGPDPQAIIDASVAALRAKIAELGADRVAAFYVEPIQGSGGVLVPPAGWLKAMRAVCRELDVLFIVDEVITALRPHRSAFRLRGRRRRTGLHDHGQGLTSGYVPMGAVFMSDHVYNTIADGAGKAQQSAMATPIPRIR